MYFFLLFFERHNSTHFMYKKEKLNIRNLHIIHLFLDNFSIAKA
jgi:hypothetical protein